ncbi:MAG TPA: hypothetical protein VHN36_21885, partial [Ilumatobacteraceae bacterium]|nr:hypothetical protein [Ilumatobacteraceae bacterium]
LPDWAAMHGHVDGAATDVLDSAELKAAIQQAVDQANESVSRAESIRTFAILPRDLTIESGELTATLKVRRAVVEKVYADEIDRIYAG